LAAGHSDERRWHEVGAGLVALAVVTLAASLLRQTRLAEAVDHASATGDKGRVIH
jgi:hypothetical protein